MGVCPGFLSGHLRQLASRSVSSKLVNLNRKVRLNFAKIFLMTDVADYL